MITNLLLVGLGLVLGIILTLLFKMPRIRPMLTCRGTRSGYLILADSANSDLKGHACPDGCFYGVVENLDTHEIILVCSPNPIEGKGKVFKVVNSDEGPVYRWYGDTTRPLTEGTS